MAPSSLQIPQDDETRSPGRKQRASHSVVVTSTTTPSTSDPAASMSSTPAYQDVYSHPAAIAYSAAHPKRTIPKFGPYLLLQTLGEGEFGKVKLGLHSQWGEEVAVKLIRKVNVDSTVRMSKVEREIEVLRTLKHTNIVRLYDVIETDKYIGIILEYASGGELFDHILAHRYLKEKDAAKLFAQLISGVWYIHQKKIVHRDLKLENLLLDRHRNVIITDFGFANRFEHRSDDLMQTSCGSPCYAAPELVISEGLYVGSAVDIWSCGVILYAMLAGYLPFDDDPANPDGDNINLLYKYIVNTPLSFPEYISEEARDLLSMMLVPDPKRRADLSGVMRHPWLAQAVGGGGLMEGLTGPGATAFGKGVEELERAAMEQHQQKRLAYQRQMRAAATQSPATNTTISPTPSSRTQSQRVDPRRNKQEYLYETGGTTPVETNPPVSASHGLFNTRQTPKSPVDDDDPFGPPISVPTAATPEKRKAGARHTIQVEYDEPAAKSPNTPSKRARTTSQTQQQPAERTRTTSQGQQATSPKHSHSHRERAPSNERVPSNASSPRPRVPSNARSPSTPGKERTPSSRTPSKSRPEPPHVVASNADEDVQMIAPFEQPQVVLVPDTLKKQEKEPERERQSGSQGSSSAKKHKRGKASITDAFGIGRVFGSGEANGTPATMSREPSESQSSTHSQNVTPSKEGIEVKPKGSSSRRNTLNTLTVMVEPFSRTIKNRGKGSAPGSRTPSATTSNTASLDKEQMITPVNGTKSAANIAAFQANAPRLDPAGMQASTSKAKKVMAWFRTRGKGKDSTNSAPLESAYQPPERQDRATTPTQATYGYAEPPTPTSAPVQVIVTTPSVTSPPVSGSGMVGSRSASKSGLPTPTSSIGRRFRESITIGGSTKRQSHQNNAAVSPLAQLRVHRGGAVDHTMVTNKPPLEAIQHVRKVLEEMGLELSMETEFKYRCVRAKRVDTNAEGDSVAAFTIVGSAASNGIDKRGLPAPSSSSFHGGMLRGLLMRRQSSQVPAATSASTTYDEDAVGNNSSFNVISEPSALHPTLYGDAASMDVGDEVRFSIELTRLAHLTDTLSLDIRRMKGNLRSYKFLYETLRDRVALSRL